VTVTKLSAPLFLACLLATALAQDAKKDMDALQGAWKVVDYKGPEEAFAKEFKSKGKIVFEGDKMTILIGDVKFGEATYRLDGAKKPKHIDVITTDGCGKDKIVLGIYALDGDKLTMFSHDDEKLRPKDFAYKSGEAGGLVTLKREPPEKKKNAER
jgi:uncharacterized protein (TIGR03067 family)